MNNKDLCRDSIYNEKTKNRNMIKVFDGSGTKDKDLFLELCNDCKNRGVKQSENSKNVKIISYSNLKKGDNNDPLIPHRSDLCLKCLKGYTCRRYFSTSTTEGSFVSGPLSPSHTKTTLSSNLNHKNIRYERSTFSFPILHRVGKENFSSTSHLFISEYSISSSNDNLNIKVGDSAPILLPPFQEILDKIEFSSGLTSSISQRSFIKDIIESYGVINLSEKEENIIKNIMDTEFYKEFYNTLNNLEEGGYYLGFFFYSNIGRANPLNYSFYTINYSSNPKTVSYNSQHLNLNFGYINLVEVNYSKLSKTGDLSIIILKIYLAITYLINDFKDTGKDG